MTYLYEMYDAGLFEQRFKDAGLVEHMGGYSGIETLFDMLMDLARGIGEPLKVDPIALSIDYSYYESIDEFNGSGYGKDYKSIEQIGNETQVRKVPGGGLIIRNF